MAAYAKKQRWRRWAGPHSDLRRAVELGLDALTPVHGGAKPDVLIEIVTGDLTFTMDNVARFAEIDSRDLAAIKSASINIGSWGSPARISIRIDDDIPALSVEVHGDNRTLVEGVASQLSEILDRSGSPRYWPGRFLAAFIVAAVLVLGLLLGGTLGFLPDRWRGEEGDFTLAEGLFLALSSLAMGLGAGGTYWLVPDLEILGTGSHTRLRRLRVWAFGFLGAVAAGIVAATILR